MVADHNETPHVAVGNCFLDRRSMMNAFVPSALETSHMTFKRVSCRFKATHKRVSLIPCQRMGSGLPMVVGSLMSCLQPRVIHVSSGSRAPL